MTLAFDTQVKYNADSDLSDTPPVETAPNVARSIEEMLSNKKFRLTALRIVDRLPSTERTLFRLRDLEGYSTYETAEITGMPICCVKNGLHLARILLKNSMEFPSPDLSDC